MAWVTLTSLLVDKDKNFHGELEWVLDETVKISSPVLHENPELLTKHGKRDLKLAEKITTIRELLKLKSFCGIEWNLRNGILTYFTDGLVEINGSLKFVNLLMIDLTNILLNQNKNPKKLGL